MQLKIGHLDPVDDGSGQRARWNNLGYEAGIPDEELPNVLEEFQFDHGLTPTGIFDSATQAKLVQVRGC
jgi:peptidoglycan hydrolase-like protein with peptidoglycan-binding domain